MKMEEIFCFLVIGLSMVLGGYFGWFLLEPK
jgi:hypothetical protein